MSSPSLFCCKDGVILDSFGRERIFRGVNLAGTKVPAVPDGQTRFADNLDTRGVSFVGRPFPEEQADEHLSRLASIGCTLIRWNITWEAVEHENPGEYDETFLAYLRRLLLKCEEYGIFVFIDPHQDVWSRWTGGDGAPAWTLEKCGFDLAKLYKTGAAFTHQDEGKSYKDMTWQLNYTRYACATMFTLFFAGSVFAPRFLIDGIPAGEFLQSHFINAMAHTARRIKDCKAVIGFGIINEPHPGFIGVKDVTEPMLPNAAKGFVLSPFESMKAAAGLGGEARRFTGTRQGFKLLEAIPIPAVENGAFCEGFSCPWKQAGVWDVDETGTAVLLKKDYFSLNGGTFANDFYKPFQKRFIAALEKKHERYLYFVEGSAEGNRSIWDERDIEKPKIIDAFHWYDAVPLLFKKWIPFFTIESDTRKIVVGKNKVRASFIAQLKRHADVIRGEGLPALLGEFGVPFDMNKGASFRTGDYSGQFDALRAYYNALDELLLSCTLWNYTAYNTHEGGDGWNKEDLSIFCADDKLLRAQKAYCRPFAMAVAGKILRMKFFDSKPVFELEWESDVVPECSAELSDAETLLRATEIFVPAIWFPNGWRVERAEFDGTIIPRPENRRLFIITRAKQRCFLRITAA